MFETPLGLWALLALIPFIIIYLRRPRPQDKVIPSLMFLIKNKKQSNRSAFFRKFIQNLLFYLQLLAILLLALSIASPFITAPYDVTMENTVLILDVSGSMQAEENGVSRFDNAVKEAKKVFSGRNSIILAEEIPLIVLEEETSDAALTILSKIKPKATSTNLGDALLLAKDILGERPGRVVVISDFSNVDGPDLEIVKKVLTSEDKVVDFIDVSNNVANAGIVNLIVEKHKTKVYVKNFKEKEETIKLKLLQDNKELGSSGNIKVLPKSIESFIFDDTPTGVSQIILEPKDNFMLDNKAFISAPLKKTIDVLLITNKASSNLELALESSKDINLCVVNPPVLTICTGGDRNGQKIEPYEQDLIIVSEINNVGQRNGILPGTFIDISSYVEEGGKLIYTSQENINTLDLKRVSIVKFGSKESEANNICIDIFNEFTKQFEKDICFSTISKYFKSTLSQDAVKIVSTQDEDKTPLVVIKNLGEGKVAYYGILDDYSEFKTLPSYPVFWNDLVNFMVETEKVEEFNYVTGKILTVPEQNIKTPSGSIKATKIIMDEAGIYEFNGKKVAVNLIDEQESDLSAISIDEEEKNDSLLEKERKEHNFSIAPFILLIVFLLLALETFYIKRRGDA